MRDPGNEVVTPLGETKSIPVCFIWESHTPPPPQPRPGWKRHVGTPIWWTENSVNIWNLLWLSRPLIITTEKTSIYISTLPNALTSKRAQNYEMSIYFSTNSIVFQSRISITRNFKMLWFANETRYWAVKLLTDINMPPLKPDKVKTFVDL